MTPRHSPHPGYLGNYNHEAPPLMRAEGGIPASPEAMALFDAERMNAQWDALLLKQMRSWRYKWNGFDLARADYTDADKRAERRRFQGKIDG